MKISIILTCFLFVFGCSIPNIAVEETRTEMRGTEDYLVNIPKKNIHYYVEQLAQQVFLTSQNIKLNNSIAIGTILPSQDIDGDKSLLLNPIALQIQESLVTLASQAGLKVIEFKTAKAIKITSDRDIMLSRDIEDLHETINADYYLTGTYAVQENSLLVNIRLIEVVTQNVIAAATDVIPDNVMWNQHSTVMKDNNIYRSSY